MGGLNDEIQKLGMLIAQKLYPGYSGSAVSEILAGNLYVTPPALEQADIVTPKKRRIPILYGSARNTEDSVRIDDYSVPLLHSLTASYPNSGIKKIELGKEIAWYGVYAKIILDDGHYVKLALNEQYLDSPREFIKRLMEEVDNWHVDKFGWRWDNGKRAGPLIDALEVVTLLFKSIAKAIEAAAEDPSLSRFQQIEWK